MQLSEIVKIKKTLDVEATVITQGDKIYSPSDFSNFAIIRKRQSGIYEGYSEKDNESLEIYANMLNIQNPSTQILSSDGFLICPLVEGEDLYPLIYVDYDKLELSEEAININKVLTSDNKSMWAEYPCELLNTVFSLTGNEYVCEAGIQHHTIDTSNTLKIAVKALDMIRKMRIQFGNNLVNNEFRTRGKREYDNLKAEDDEKIIKRIVDDYKGLVKSRTDKDGNFKKFTKRNFKGTPLINEYSKFQIIEMYINICSVEEKCKNVIKDEVHYSDLWNQYLVGINGCGELTAAYILTKLNPYIARHPSAFIRYAGMDVQYNKDKDRYEGRNKSHRRKMVIMDKNNNPKIIDNIGYDPEFKSRILGILVPSFIKCGKGYYNEVYYGAKQYYLNRPDLKERWENKPKGDTSSAHKMAVRKTGYLFLVDLWLNWRTMLGLPLNGGTYEEAKLNIIHKYGGERPKLIK